MFISKIVQDRLRHNRIDANNAMIALTRKVLTSADKYEHVKTIADYLNVLHIDKPRVKAKQLIDELLVIYRDDALNAMISDVQAQIDANIKQLERLTREKKPRLKRLTTPTELRITDRLRTLKVGEKHVDYIDSVFRFFTRLNDGHWALVINNVVEILVYDDVHHVGWFSYKAGE